MFRKQDHIDRWRRVSLSRRAWLRLSSAQRETVILIVLTIATWFVVERTETCDRVFAWIAQHPDTEIDSVILALLLALAGGTISACRRFLELRKALRDRDMAERHAQNLALHDPLTGLKNRRALTERLERLHRAGNKPELGLIFFDLDRFKAVNDMHGHQVGDRLLRLVAARAQEKLAMGQTAYRLGGDELAVTVEMGRDTAAATEMLARRIIKALSLPFEDQGLVHHIGASAGIAMFPTDASGPDELVRAADVALYSAKNAARGTAQRYDKAMDQEAIERVKLEGELRRAIRSGEFRPFYQPVIDLKTGKTVGYEMLARWQREDGVRVGPDRFIPVAEEYGLIGDIFFELLERVCEETRDWDPSITIAINISPVQLKDPWLAQKILAALVRSSYPPHRIAIEITENALIADETNARRTILALKNQGMRIGLDDFGTGYSSLHHLRVLPFDRLKIDQSYIRNLDFDPEARKIVRAIQGLASSLDLVIIAEGIETEEIAAIVRELGCDQGQGYLYGRPEPAESCLPPQPHFAGDEMMIRAA